MKAQKAKIEALKREIEELKTQKERLERELALQKEQKAKENMRDVLKKVAIAKESQAVYNKLVSNYSTTIVEDDWKNIDLLIFYLQSGRAESCKEALQLVDRQRQTDQIAKAIADASQSISNSIRNYTQILGNLIMQSTVNLESQIRSLRRDMSGWQRETARQMSELGESLDRSMDAQMEQNRQLLEQGAESLATARLQTALLEKSSETSDRLIYELRYNQRLWNK